LAVVHAGFLRFRVSGCFPAGFNFDLIYVVVEVYHDFICFVFCFCSPWWRVGVAWFDSFISTAIFSPTMGVLYGGCQWSRAICR
jgi:hypothetical protein